MIKLNEKVLHDGKSYEPNDTIEKINKNQAQRLVDLGVAFFVETIQPNQGQQNEDPPMDNLSFEGIDLEDLKAAAKEVGVQFNVNIGFDKLIERIKEEGKTEDVLSQFEGEE